MSVETEPGIVNEVHDGAGFHVGGPITLTRGHTAWLGPGEPRTFLAIPAKATECRNCGAPVHRRESVCSYCNSVQ